MAEEDESKRIKIEDEENVDEDGEEVDEEEDSELKVIQEEFKIWKKNSPFLYDICIRHVTRSAPLTCQWLPPKTEVEAEYSSHEILLGMKKTDKLSNCLGVMRVFLPNEGVELDVKEFNEKTQELSGYAANVSKLNPIIEVVHDGDANRARFMPSDYFVVATRMGVDVGIFKFDSMESKPKDDQCRPLLRGVGHTEEGYGLDWSTRTAGHLLSCGDDGTFLWNVERLGAVEKSMTLLRKFAGAASDCAWNPHSNDVFTTVSLDGKVASTFWDIRASKSIFQLDAGSTELNAISYNPHKEHLFVTGGSGKVVQLWDDRKIEIGKPEHELNGHTGEVYAMQWAPFSESILATCGEDRRVLIWDLDRIGREQTPEEAEDGDPELLFIHGGHCSRVMDISWNPNDDWVLATVADNGLDGDLQVWQPASHIYEDDDDEDDDDKEDLE